MRVSVLMVCSFACLFVLLPLAVPELLFWVYLVCKSAVYYYFFGDFYFWHYSQFPRIPAEKPRAPSYFSAYFKCQLAEVEQQKANGEESHGIKTLYIDRDPVTFADISRHLQGYHIQPRDGAHFVKLFADAQFYQRKLFCHLFTTIC